MMFSIVLLVFLSYLSLAVSFQLSSKLYSLTINTGIKNRLSMSSTLKVENTEISTKKLTNLCLISKEACDIVAPMLQAFYTKITSNLSSKLKSDNTYFTIADGIIQHLMIEYLFQGNKFYNIVGEEDETKVNILSKPFMVDDLIIPEEFNDIIEVTLEKIKQLSLKIDASDYKDITIFLDPIDGTREFATGKGEYVTILIGYNNLHGHPIAGIMYRPLTNPPTWAIGSKEENFALGNLDYAKEPKHNGLLITDGKVSPFISHLIDELGYERIPSLASGNRAMMLLENKAGAYIRDTGGFAKWDTSGPQAVIEAFGGTMSILPDFLKDQSLISYTHLKSNINLDFQENEDILTLTNAKDKSMFHKDQQVLISNVHQVKEYVCLRGLIALNKENMKNLNQIHQKMIQVKVDNPPYYT